MPLSVFTGTKFRLQTIIFGCLVLISLIPVLLLGLWVQQHSLENEYKAVKEKHLIIAKNLSREFQRYITDTKSAFSFVNSVQLPPENHIYGKALLSRYGITAACIFYPDKTARNRFSNNPCSFQLNPSQEAVLYNTSGNTLLSDLTRIHDRPAFLISKALGDNAIAVGVLETTYLKESQRSIAFGERGHSMIVDATGKVIAHPNEEWEFTSKDASAMSVVKKMMAGTTGVSTFFSPPMQAEMIAGHTAVPGEGWGIMVPQPIDELADNAGDVHLAVIIISLMGLTVSTFLSWIAARHLAHPIERISQSVASIATEKISAISPVKHQSRIFIKEVDDLTQLFNKMLGELQTTGKALQIHQQTLEKSVEERTAKLQEEIQQRTAAEQKLRLSGQVFGSANEAILITDQNLSIIEVNPAYCKIMNVRPEQIIGAKAKFGDLSEHKPETLKAMWQAIEQHGNWQGEINGIRYDGESFPKWLSVSAMHNDKGEVLNYIGIFSDISPLKTAESQLKQLAYYDQLTALPNRTLLYDRIEQSLQRIRAANIQTAFMYLDLDQFKQVNDTLGHAIGDMLLQHISRRLTESVRPTDTVSRIGGDEFTILLHNVAGKDDAAQAAQAILDSFSTPFVINNIEISVGTSIGICMLPDDADTVQQALKRADMAMYGAKSEGRGHYHFYDAEEGRKLNDSRQLQQELVKAIHDNQLFLLYQPIVDAHTGQIASVEALIRWQHPEKGLLTPDTFIALAEESNLILDLGDWVIKQACTQALAWQEELGFTLPVAINLSAREFSNPELVERVRHVLSETGTRPDMIEIEITETSAMKNTGLSTSTLRRLRGIGINISIDDFGTGYSSLAYLKRLSVDKIKIDRSFIQDLTSDDTHAAFVKLIIEFSKELGYKVVAEGVETEDQQTILRQLQCDFIQGYLHSKPVSAARITERYARKEALTE